MKVFTELHSLTSRPPDIGRSGRLKLLSNQCFLSSSLTSKLVHTCLTYFSSEKGKYRVSWCRITAGKQVQMRCFSPLFFLSSPQLIPWFPLWSCACPTFGRGDTPRFINPLTWLWDTLIQTQTPVRCEKDRVHKSQRRCPSSEEYIHDFGSFYEAGDGRLTPDES